MPSDLRVSDFLMQAAQSMSKGSAVIGGIGDKLFEAERVSQVNAGQVEIDRAFDEYARNYKKQLFGDPTQPFDPLAPKPVVGDISEYQKARTDFIAQYANSIPKTYKNPYAQKQLLAYVNQKGLALEQYVYDRYTEYRIGQLQAVGLETADEILRTYPDPAMAKAAIDDHFDSLVANGVYDGLTGYKLKLGYYKDVFVKEQGQVKDYADDLVVKIQNGLDVKEAEELFSKRLDSSIALGAYGVGDRDEILEEFRDSSVVNATAGKAIIAMSGADGYLTPDGLDQANKIIARSSLTPVQKADAYGVVYGAYTKKYSAEQAAIKAYDQPLVDKFSSTLLDIIAIKDPTKRLEQLTAFSQEFNAKQLFTKPKAYRADGSEPIMDANATAWGFKSQATKIQLSVDLQNAMGDALKAYSAATNDEGKAYADNLRGRWAGLEVAGTTDEIVDFEVEVRGLMMDGTFSGESLGKVETLLTNIAKRRADITTTAQDASYVLMKNKLAGYDQAAAFYDMDNDIDALSGSYTDTVGYVLDAIGNTNLKPSQYSELLGDALQKAGDYTKKIAAANKKSRELAVATFEQENFSTVKELSDIIDRVVDKKGPKSSELLSAIAALEKLGPDLESFYVKGDPNKSWFTDAGYKDIQGNIDSALEKGRKYVASVDSAAATATAESKKDSTNKTYWDLRGSYGQKLSMDVGGVKAGTVVTKDVIELFIKSNWATIDGPDGKMSSLSSLDNDAYSTERALLKKGLDDLYKNGKINESEYSGAMQQFDDTTSGKGGKPTRETVGASVTTILEGLRGNGPKKTLELGGPGNSFNTDGHRLMYSAYNGKLAGASVVQEKTALLGQTAKTLGSYLGFDEAEAKRLVSDGLAGGRQIQVKTSSGLVKAADVPTVYRDGFYWTMVPADYSPKTKEFSGELKLAKVDPTTGIATILDNQNPVSKIVEQRNLALAKVNQAGEKLYQGMYDSAYIQDAFINMVNDKALLQALGLKTGATKDDIFGAVYRKYAEYASSLESKNRDKVTSSKKVWDEVKSKFLAYVKNPSKLAYGTTDMQRFAIINLKTNTEEVFQEIRKGAIKDASTLKGYDDDLRDRGIDPYKN